MFTSTLSKRAQNALAILGRSHDLPSHSYLAGGSALALHFGHRVSIDFDFFTPLEFNPDTIATKLKKIGDFQLSQKEEGTLLGLFNKVKFSLFIYRYPLISKPVLFEEILIAHPKDIAAMKLAAICDRGTKKDFIDLYFLVKNGISIEQAFSLYESKYKAFQNNTYTLITSLSYFEDAHRTDVPRMIEKIQWDEIESFFKKESIRLAKKFL